MASWIISTVLMGAASAASMGIVSEIVSLLGILNTSVQGISNVSKIIRSNPDCDDIRKILDDDLLLEIRVSVMKHFIEDLKDIVFSYRTKEILESIIPNINKCTDNIRKQLDEINKKIEYNNSLWFFSSWRKYRFGEDEKILRDLSSKLNMLEDRFFKILDEDPHYFKYKTEKKTGFSGVEKERMLQSACLSSKIFGK
jgi:hypothetical protein